MDESNMDEGENADALGRYSVVHPAGCLVRSGTEMQTPFVGTVACGTVVDVGQLATLADGGQTVADGEIRWGRTSRSQRELSPNPDR